ncbi:MAG: DNA adenine methylase [Chloroflexota bacterium]|nr:DNA adenine methylase [Chloroflexota bacterium]MDE2841459.1 DNA adenine methylase [Chloroflexota bacterium]
MSATFDSIITHTHAPYLDRARARPFVKWAGGKRALVPDIAQRMPESFETYWEPFVGGGAVFFSLDSRINIAQLSDVNASLALTYQVVRNNVEKLIEHLECHAEKHCKEHYYAVRKMTDLKDSVEVAARFIYLNKTCYNGLYRVNKAGNFNVPVGRYKNPTVCDADNLRAASQVLQKATVRLSDFHKAIPGSGDFVYADPPYDGASVDYDASGFGQEEQRRLRDTAVRWHTAGAAVMISNADTALIRGLYGHAPFVLHEVTAPRTINCKADAREAIGELLITSY